MSLGEPDLSDLLVIEDVGSTQTEKVALSTLLNIVSRNAVQFAVDSATVIAVGDALWMDTDDVKPASDVTDQGTEAANQEYFHDRFAGIALEASGNGETDDIWVATMGLFTLSSPSSTYEVGDLVGMDENGSGDGLLDQTVASVGGSNLAVGRVSARVAPAATSVQVAIVSTVLWGGPQDVL